MWISGHWEAMVTRDDLVLSHNLTLYQDPYDSWITRKMFKHWEAFLLLEQCPVSFQWYDAMWRSLIHHQSLGRFSGRGEKFSLSKKGPGLPLDATAPPDSQWQRASDAPHLKWNIRSGLLTIGGLRSSGAASGPPQCAKAIYINASVMRDWQFWLRD